MAAASFGFQQSQWPTTLPIDSSSVRDLSLSIPPSAPVPASYHFQAATSTASSQASAASDANRKRKRSGSPAKKDGRVQICPVSDQTKAVGAASATNLSRNPLRITSCGDSCDVNAEVPFTSKRYCSTLIGNRLLGILDCLLGTRVK